jgi:hypothetical protein
MNRDRPLNLIWRRSILDGVLEAQFLRHILLADLPRPQRWIAVEDNAQLPDMDDVLVCSFGDCGGYLRELRAAGRRNLGILHLGDEQATDDLHFYAEADYVLRHYHRPDMPTTGGYCQAVSWMPNGWASGVGPVKPTSHLPFQERRHELFFAGHSGADGDTPSARKSMLDALAGLGRPATIIVTDGFGQGLGPAAYGGYLSDSKFALAPAGNAPETIRFYDALECGALPVVTDGPWLHADGAVAALGPPPVVILNSWRELPSLDVGRFGETHRQTAIDWWERLKAQAAARVMEIIEAQFVEASS